MEKMVKVRGSIDFLILTSWVWLGLITAFVLIATIPENKVAVLFGTTAATLIPILLIKRFYLKNEAI